ADDTVIERRFALCLLVLSILLAVGKYTPAYRVVFHLLPGFSYFRVPARLILFYGFAVALLAGLGMRRVIQGPWWGQRQRVSGILLLGSGLLFLMIAVLTILNRGDIWSYLHHIETERSRIGLGLPEEAYREVGVRLPLGLIDGRLHAIVYGVGIAALWFWLGLLGAGLMNLWGRRIPFLGLILWSLVFGDLLWFSHRFLPTFPREEWKQRYYQEPGFLKLIRNDMQSYRVIYTDETVIGPGYPGRQECKHNRPMQLGIKAVRGYDPIQLAGFASFINVIQSRDPLEPQGGMLYIRYPWQIDPIGYELTATKYIVTSLDVPDSFEPIWADSFSPIRVYRNTKALPEVRLLDDPEGNVQILKQRAGLLEVQVHSDRNTSLFWSQCDYPGWHVTVDGEKQALEPLLGVFLEVDLPAGDHTVRFSFSPAIVYWGIGISVLVLLALTSLCVREKWIRRG
ncbi:MAG: YfhO family protein, partial [bacterium]